MQRQNKVLRKSTQDAEFSLRGRSNINDDKCGSILSRNDDRIVGGEETEPYEYPWNVALTLRWGLQFCGGSLINERVKRLSTIRMY